jgi:hypothetical protein
LPLLGDRANHSLERGALLDVAESVGVYFGDDGGDAAADGAKVLEPLKRRA